MKKVFHRVIGTICAIAASAWLPASAQPVVMKKDAVEQSPIVFFRGLLEKSPSERASALADRNDFQRRFILRKIAEYEAMDPGEAELRLKTTELRWYLKKLVRLEGRQRQAWLAGLEDSSRELLAARLNAWDTLSPAIQKGILEHEQTMEWVRKMDLATPEERTRMLAAQDPAERVEMEVRLKEWRKFSDSERERITALFMEFFELSEKERARILVRLSGDELKSVVPVISRLEVMDESELRQYVAHFNQMAAMAPLSRYAYLNHARQWKILNRQQQSNWKGLVVELPPLPPSPPGMLPPPHPSISVSGFVVELPPLPPGLDMPTIPTVPSIAGVR